MAGVSNHDRWQSRPMTGAAAFPTPIGYAPGRTDTTRRANAAARAPVPFHSSFIPALWRRSKHTPAHHSPAPPPASRQAPLPSPQVFHLRQRRRLHLHHRWRLSLHHRRRLHRNHRPPPPPHPARTQTSVRSGISLCRPRCFQQRIATFRLALAAYCPSSGGLPACRPQSCTALSFSSRP